MELVGRATASSAAAAAWDRARRGHGGVLLVTGEAGIGKTSVVRAVVEAVADAAAGEVRWAACWENGEQVLQPWVDLLRWPGGDAGAELAERLAALDDGAGAGEVGGTHGVDPPSLARARQQLATDVVGTLRTMAAARPQLLVLDDLQWADHSSTSLLRAVAAQAPAMALLVLATVRTGEAGAALLDLGGLVEQVHLPPLPASDVAALLADRLGREPSEDEVRSVHERSGGNPLFAVQLAHLLAAGAPLGLPAPVGEVLGRRFAHLPTDAMAALGAAAVLGSRFDPQVVAEMLDRDPAAALADLDQARAAGLIGPDPDRAGGWAFGHALIVDARLAQLPSADRARLHARALTALTTRGLGERSAAVLAHHAAHADLPREDPAPAHWSLAAGHDAAARLDAADAAIHFERARAQAPPGPAGDRLRAEAWLGLGGSHLRQGDDDAAGDAFDRAADLGATLGDADLVARAALGFGAGLAGFEIRMLDPRQATLLQRAADLLGADAPLRPPVLARLSVASAYRTTSTARLALADEAVAAARASGDRSATATALAARCDALAGPAEVDHRLAMAKEIVELATAGGDRRAELLGRRFLVVALAERLDLVAFDREVDAFELVAARVGDPLFSWYVDLWRGARAVGWGRLDDARAHVAEAQRLGELAGSANAQVLTAVLDVFVLMAADGDAACGRSPMFESLDLERLGLANVGPMTLFARYHQGAPGVREAVTHHLDHLDDMTVDAEWLPAMVPLVELVQPLGLQRYAPALYERLLPYADLGAIEGIGAAIRGPVHRWLAVAAADAGDEAAALEHADAALAAATAIGTRNLAQTQDAIATALEHLGTERATERALPLRSEGSRWHSSPSAAVGTSAVGTSAFVREGDHWAVTFDGTTVRSKHSKGMADLAVLLDRPGQEVHVRTLAGGTEIPEADGAPVLDEQAVAAYRARLVALEDELDEADRHHDLVRSARLATERDALVDELTGAFGLGGRARRLGSGTDERMRKAVSGRLRAAIDRLGQLHPALGRHLTNAVRTGTWCRYQPEQPTSWLIER